MVHVLLEIKVPKTSVTSLVVLSNFISSSFHYCWACSVKSSGIVSVNVIKCVLRYTLKWRRMHYSSTALTITAVSQVGPDDVFLWKAEHSETASSHACVNNNSRVCNQVGTFIQLYSVPKQKHHKHVALTSKSSKVWILQSLRHLTWCIPLGVCASDSSGRTSCPSSPHYEGLSTASALDCLCLQCATENSSGTPLARF